MHAGGSGIRLHAVPPLVREEYEEDFGEASRQEFRELLACAEEVFVAPPAEVKPDGDPPRGWFYRQAGMYIAMRAH